MKDKARAILNLNSNYVHIPSHCIWYILTSYMFTIKNYHRQHAFLEHSD